VVRLVEEGYKKSRGDGGGEVSNFWWDWSRDKVSAAGGEECPNIDLFE
jgi:hypothetical protein